MATLVFFYFTNLFKCTRFSYNYCVVARRMKCAESTCIALFSFDLYKSWKNRILCNRAILMRLLYLKIQLSKFDNYKKFT